MSRVSRVLPAVLALTVGSAASVARAEDSDGGFPFELFASPEKILEQVAKALSDNYELDDGQTEYAKELLSEYTRSFLQANAEDIDALKLEFLKAALNPSGSADDGDYMSADAAKRLKRLFGAGRETLDQFSKEFRAVLDEDQRTRFDLEKKQLELLVAVAETEADKRLAREEGRGGKATADIRKSARRFNGAGFLEQRWEEYKLLFAEHYGLDESQNRKADEMVASAKRAAADYRKANEDAIKRFTAAYRRLREAFGEKGLTAEARQRLDAERKSLDAEAERFESPLREMYERLKADLDSLLTEQQKKKRAFPLRNAKR